MKPEEQYPSEKTRELVCQLLWGGSLLVFFGGYTDYAFGLAFASGFLKWARN